MLFNKRSWALVIIVLWGALLRIYCASLFPNHMLPGSDAEGFREVGLRFWQTYAITGLHFHMPLYPIITGLLGSIGTAIFDIFVSIATVVLVYILAIQIWRDRLAALFASFFAATYPLLIFFSAVGFGETLYITLSLAAFVCWYDKKFFYAGCLSVLAILTRPTFDVIAPVMIVCFSLVVFRQPLRMTLRHLAIYAGVYLALMAPWWINNFRVYGGFVRLVPMSAAVLYVGNNPMNKTGAATVDVDFQASKIHVEESELSAANARLRTEALTFIRDNPWRFIELGFKKVSIFWRPWPIGGAYSGGIYFWLNLLSAGPIILFGAIGLALLARNDVRKSIPIFLYFAVNTAIVFVLIGATRYRMPLEPFLFVLAAMPVVKVVRWTKGWMTERRAFQSR